MYSVDLIRALARRMPHEGMKGIGVVLGGLANPVERESPQDSWWTRPGLGIMYQVEYRPGEKWSRDFDRFNRRVTDQSGRLRFDGPFCKVEQWVELSRDTGADYHVMEIKWHDGICYFDTDLTDWKTETDYAGLFAERSRVASIPFMYYYSTIFDHNPDFDSIQPSPRTISFIGMPTNTAYDRYLRGQYEEIMEKYRPDGMWIDWYWPDQATDTTIDFFRSRYPDTVLAFNASNLMPSSYSRIDYTSGEAHDLEGPYIRIMREEGGLVPVFSSAWKWANLSRRTLGHPWELIAPAGRWWQDPVLRDDPSDLLRMAAVIMACGGRMCLGATAAPDGGIYPDQVEQLGILGSWYRPRKELFSMSTPLRYRLRQPSGVRVYPQTIKAIACRNEGDILLHLVNMDGTSGPAKVEMTRSPYIEASRAVLEPSAGAVELLRSGSTASILFGPGEVDAVDTIIRLQN